MPIPFLSQESPNLAIVDWYLIATEEVSIRADVIEITRMRQSLSGMNRPAMEMSCDCCLCCCALESAKGKGKQKKYNGRSCSQE